MIDWKKVKSALDKDKLLKFKIDKEKVVKFKKKFSKLIEEIKEALTKEKMKKWFEAIRVSFNKDKKPYITFGSIALVVIIAIGASIISYSNNSKEVLNKKYAITNNEAEEYFYAGKYDQAIEQYKKLDQKDTAEGLWDAKISEIYSIKGDLENSNAYINKAKELGSKNSEVLNCIVFTEFMNKDYKTALQQGEEALGAFPKDKSLIKTMFTVYMANNMADKAKSLISMYPLDGKSAYDNAEYARMLMVVGESEKGYQKLRSAWYIDRDEYKIYDVLAQISVYDKDNLLQDVTSLSEKNPDDLSYKMWLAKIYSLSDASADQANQLVDTLKTQDVGKIEIKLIEAAALQGLKQNDKADELLKKVIDENKNDYRVLHTAGWYYLNKMNFTTAEKYCRESIIKNKDYPDNYGFLMPEILKAEGKTVEAEPYFRTALLKEPYNYNIMLTVANYYWYTAKDTTKAMDSFKIAEFIKPNEPEIKYNMALIDVANKKNDDAISILQQCIKLSDDVAKYHRTLGTIYLLNGKPADAISEIRYAYASDQEDILTLNNAGCYYATQDVNLVKGEYNLRKAQEGINASTDKYTADTIKSNYSKVKDLLDKYNNGSGGTVKIPDLTLFY